MSLPEELNKVLYADLSWHEKALCKGATEVFFPEKGKSQESRYAKNICSNCPVSQECLKYAITNNIRFGIWGGHTYKERIRLKKSIK